MNDLPSKNDSEGLESISAVILAGGLGTRLRPVVTDRPKVLARVGGRPFLAYLLDQLTAVGIGSGVLCTGYMGDQVRDIFGDAYGSLRLSYSQEPAPLGTGGALRLALPLIPSETMLVLNGDSFCETDFKAFWTWHTTRGAAASILLTEVADTRRYGRVLVDADGRVLKFEEKNGDSGPGWINAGLYLCARKLLEDIPTNRVVSIEREMFPSWIGRGLYGNQSAGRFIDIGIPETYANAEQFFTLTVEHQAIVLKHE